MLKQCLFPPTEKEIKSEYLVSAELQNVFILIGSELCWYSTVIHSLITAAACIITDNMDLT